ncbi:MAG TPA: alpha/beta hydrolase-fold protein [Pirellulales bacterium]
MLLLIAAQTRLPRAPADQPAQPAARSVAVNLTLDPQVAEGPVSGRLFVYLSRRAEGEPRMGPNWFAPEPFFAIDVTDWKPGETRTLDDRADGFPDRVSKIPPGRYRVQAQLDHQLDTHHAAQGEGNFYSAVALWTIGPGPVEPLPLTLDRVVGPRAFQETAWLKEVVLPSPLLSDFHHRPVRHLAAVVLPPSYERQPERRYPVIYSVPGFGGTHYDAMRNYATGAPPAAAGETEFIRVALSGDCKWGHHVFADSATNGPRGTALVEELVPHIDARFRTVAAPSGRFVTGHSSGGWASLWLQVSQPDTFGGVWSTAPDPVDFRDWQQVNLYVDPPLSLYYDQRGAARPIARRGVTPVLWYASFAKMDDVLGRGGQLRSFEAVFSPLDEEGQPRRMWDRRTGQIDPVVARAWSKYDIRQKLEREWSELGPKLRGKLHVYTGALDTFYLDGAVRKLADSMKQLGSDAEIVVVPGRDHRDLLSADLIHQMRRQMTEAFRKAQAVQ